MTVTGNPDHDALLLSGALAARLCHDLAGPLGTVIGALDLAERADEEALVLAREATTDLVQRLRLCRAAWAEGAGPTSVAELAGLAQGLDHRRVRVDLTGMPASARLGQEFGRVLLNVLLLGAEGMPRGGTLAVQGDPGAEVAVMLAGAGAAWPPGAAETLANPARALAMLREHQAAMQPRHLLAPLAALLAARAGLRLGVLLGAAGTEAPPLLITRA